MRHSILKLFYTSKAGVWNITALQWCPLKDLEQRDSPRDNMTLVFLKENKSIQITAPLWPTIKSDLEEQNHARLVINANGLREEREGPVMPKIQL